MHRIILTAALLLIALAASPFWPGAATAGVTGAKVVFLGEMGKTASQAPPAGAPQGDIAGGPGIRFGMELIPEGSPLGAPVVLEARLKRPEDPEDAPPIRWLVAARIGIPVMSVWEFAYDWEVEPGVWTMTVSYEDAVLATASFTVIQSDSQARTQAPPAPKSSEPGDARQEKKAPAPVAAKPQASAPKPESLKPETPKPEMHRPETPRQEPGTPAAAKPAEPAKPAQSPPQDRPPKPLGEVQSPGAAAPKGVAGPPGKRVQVLVGGVYSEEARALWVASFLKGRGVKACVRAEERGGKRRWSVVAGWRDTPEEAKRAKDELTPVVGEISIVPMSAADLEKGLQCR